MSEKRTYAQRLAASIAAMPNPVKDTKAYNYKYETLDQVLGIVQPALAANGLVAVQGIEDADFGWHLYTAVLDTESGERHVLDRRPLVFSFDPQKDGSSETYARRYALKTAFGLCGEDDDGAAASNAAKAAKAKQASNQPPKRKTAPQTASDGPSDAKKRLWAAVQAFAKHEGRDAKEVLKEAMESPDWDDTDDYYTMKAFEFELAVK